MVAKYRTFWFDLIALIGVAVVVWSFRSHFPDVDSFGVANIPYAFPEFPIGVALILIGVPSSVLMPRLTEIAPVAFLARISFGIYVWHFLLLECVRVLYQPRFGYWGMVDTGQWAWLSAGVVAAAIIVATTSYYVLEAPIIRWARGFERRPANDAPTLSPAAG
jgi:peptidoglycan/LPS O-acetylase OafA/YrhL